jgi:hypothetical protein
MVCNHRNSNGCFFVLQNGLYFIFQNGTFEFENRIDNNKAVGKAVYLFNNYSLLRIVEYVFD